MTILDSDTVSVLRLKRELGNPSTGLDATSGAFQTALEHRWLAADEGQFPRLSTTLAEFHWILLLQPPCRLFDAENLWLALSLSLMMFPAQRPLYIDSFGGSARRYYFGA